MSKSAKWSLSDLNERQRKLALILVMTTVTMVAGGLGVLMLYVTALSEQKDRLRDVVHARARLLEQIGGEHGVHQGSPQSSGSGVDAATLRQAIDANRSFEGFGETGEFALARRRGEAIVFLHDRRHSVGASTVVPWDSELAEPMREALKGNNGSMVGRDYSGQWVLAAYEPVGDLGWGMVAKIDMAEIQWPFLVSAALGIVLAIFLVLLGATAFTRLLNPLIRRLQDSEAQTRAILEAAPDGIITIDDQGIVQSFNATGSALFGYDPNEMCGKHVTGLIPEGHRTSWNATFRRHMKESKTKRSALEVVGLRKDGSTFPILLSVGETLRHGDRVLYTGICRDLSDRKVVEQRMEQAARLAAMGELSANVAHEVNNPIGIISAKARLILSGKEDLSPKVRTDLEKITTQCDRISQLTRGLLGYCRPIDTPRSPVSVNIPLRASLSFVESKATRCNIEVLTNLGHDLPIVQGNNQEFEQVFLNLLLNAIHAMPEGGTLSVESRVADNGTGGLLVRVEDTGVGMDEKTCARVFEPFFSTKGAEGTGLGLSISHGLIAKHGGAIRVESSVGEGTLFTVTLPTSNSKPKADRDQPAEPDPRH